MVWRTHWRLAGQTGTRFRLMWLHVLQEETRVALIGESHMFSRLRHRGLQRGGNSGGSHVAELLLHLPHRQPDSAAACANN